ncbi:MAG: pyridoxamine 5'-phosphate oxidase family protein [Epsilonproteobacteria bacterium]|nr:pyridoxamine 5'-phosphate oxidase family protein [Campylobacterota bacterium]
MRWKEMAMDEKIEKFISKHHLLSLATFGESLWCCSAFYAFDADAVVFIIASDEQTVHIQNSKLNIRVAGTIAHETKVVGKIQGIQFVGEIHAVEDERQKNLYLKRFPYARAMNPTLWKLELDIIKMTDNTLGFGKKLIWKREF